MPSPTTPTTFVAQVIPRDTIITTTLFAGSTAAPDSSSSSKSSSDVPIAAIAGGAAAGVVLAITAVLIWHCWGRSIKHKEKEKRKQAFAFFQLRENTRRNASSLERNYTSYRPNATVTNERKVQFVGPQPHSRTPSKDSGVSFNEKETSATVSETPIGPAPPPASAPTVRWLHHAPVRPSPLAKSLSPPSSPSASSPTDVSQPLLSSRPATVRSNTNASTSIPALPHTLDAPKLSHKSSNTSSVSVYSTQSGEERVMRVPPSLIMAAFSRPDATHPVIPEYTPVTRLSATEYDERNRLSHASQGSTSSQTDGPVGYAR